MRQARQGIQRQRFFPQIQSNRELKSPWPFESEEKGRRGNDERAFIPLPFIPVPRHFNSGRAAKWFWGFGHGLREFVVALNLWEKKGRGMYGKGMEDDKPEQAGAGQTVPAVNCLVASASALNFVLTSHRSPALSSAIKP